MKAKLAIRDAALHCGFDHSWLLENEPKKERSSNSDVISASNVGEATDIRLTGRQRLILETMLEIGAIAHTKRTTKAIIVDAINRRHNAENYKPAFRDLYRRGFTQNSPGPEGGLWLTSKGIALASSLMAQNRSEPPRS